MLSKEAVLDIIMVPAAGVSIVRTERETQAEQEHSLRAKSCATLYHASQEHLLPPQHSSSMLFPRQCNLLRLFHHIKGSNKLS